jgi:hypothetical protein
MNESVEVYGFGSFFKKDRANAKDIDILLLHSSLRSSSLKFVKQCKSLNFLARSSAHYLINLDETDLETQSCVLIATVARFTSPHSD